MASILEKVSCRIPGCEEAVLAELAAESLCTDHFVQHAFFSAQQALDRFQQALPVHPHTLEWLFSDAAFHARKLTQRNATLTNAQKDSLLELLLCLTNLHEYVSHHAVALTAGR